MTTIFQHPDVTALLIILRDQLEELTGQYAQVKAAFIASVRTGYTDSGTTPERLQAWLETCVGDATLRAEIFAAVVAPPPPVPAWKPTKAEAPDWTCRTCGSGDVWYRDVEDLEGHEDREYHCRGCQRRWWVEGPDA